MVQHPTSTFLSSLLTTVPAANLEADPEARKVRDWRHKLQKALLGSKGVPSDEASHPRDADCHR